MAARKRCLPNFPTAMSLEPDFGHGAGSPVGDFGAGPLAVLPQLEQMNAFETGGEDLIAPIAVPVDNVNAVHQPAILRGDGLALPLARAVEHQRRVAAVIGRLGIGRGQGRVDHHAFAAAIDIGRAQAVRRGNAVDLGRSPEIPRVAIMTQHGNDARTFLRLIGEPRGQHDFGYAFGIGANHSAIDHARLLHGDDVAFPSGVLVPHQFGQAAGEGDQVGPAVVVEIRHHHLVSTGQTGGDGVLRKAGRRRGNQRQCQEEKYCAGH